MWPLPNGCAARREERTDNRWKTVARRLLAQPAWLRALSERNHLITRAYGSLWRGETLGENGHIGLSGGMLRLSLVVNQRHWLRKAGIVTPWRNWHKKRKHRRGLSTVFFVNRGAAAFCNGLVNSGGRIRTYDLRVMSYTSPKITTS